MKIKSIGANQTQVEFNRGVVLVSYETPVAAILHDNDGHNPKAYQTNQIWSSTTLRHINNWLDGRESQEKPQSFFDNLI